MKKQYTFGSIKPNFYLNIIALIAFIVAYTVQLTAVLPKFDQKNNVLLGSICFKDQVDREVEYPISYKGNASTAKVEINGDRKKAHFELYINEKITELYLLITGYLGKPTSVDIQQLITSNKHNHKLYKLTKTSYREPIDNLETWQVTEVSSSKKDIIIPDNTIILFLEPETIEAVQSIAWAKDSNIIHLPLIKIKETITKNDLYTMADKMKLAFLDFKFLHKNANLTSIPYSNNRLLSMPFTTRRTSIS